MSLRFEKNETELICEYMPDRGTDHIYDFLREHESFTVKRVFNIKKENIIESDEFFSKDEIRFIVGRKKDEYYVLDNEILEFEHTFYLHEDMSINSKTFLSYRNISILNKLDLHTTEDIFIGGNRATIPKQEFYRLIKSFPNTYELDRYADMRISSIIKDYVTEAKDYIDDYEKYMNKKITKSLSFEEENEEKRIFENEYQKFLYIRNKLQKMLRDEEQYSEKDWQNEIAKILTLIFSKYYFFVDEVTISTDEGDKRPDFIFVDIQGNIDVVEIKKSHKISVISKGKYRNNCTPSKELVGTIMQMEKYLYHLNRTVVTSEKKIKKKLLNEMQVEIDIKIRNPQGIIILGRSNSLNDEELRDYEIIKRQFKNIADIITYDDLINRLDRLLNNFRKK
ncbi:Shedu immune nuclease family protein [Enterococcus casseliflavus]